MKNSTWAKVGTFCLQFAILFVLWHGTFALIKLLPTEVCEALYLGALAVAMVVGTWVTWSAANEHYNQDLLWRRILATALFGPTLGTVLAVLYAVTVFTLGAYGLIVKPRRTATAIGLAISDAYHRHPVRPGIYIRLKCALQDNHPLRRLTPQEA